MDAIQIQAVHEEKDLGVIVSDDLKWDKQCVAVVKKTNKLLRMIKRNFIDRSIATILALYKSLIRPHLEYCIQVWNPHCSRWRLCSRPRHVLLNKIMQNMSLEYMFG